MTMNKAQSTQRTLIYLLAAALSACVASVPAQGVSGASNCPPQHDDPQETVSSEVPESGSDTQYRPAEKEPDWVLDTAVRPSSRHLVTSDFRYGKREAEEELLDKLVETIRRQLSLQIAAGAGDVIPVDRNSARKQFVPEDRWHAQLYYTPVPGGELAETFGKIDARDGKRYLEWYRCFAEVELGDEFVSWGRQQYETRLIDSRVRQSLVVIVGVLALLAGTFGILRLNHQTRGLYRGRLIFLSTVTLIVLVIVGLAAWDSMVRL